MEELRKLRKLNDEVSSLRPSLRAVSVPVGERRKFAAEPKAEQEVEQRDERTTTSVQNEPIVRAYAEFPRAGNLCYRTLAEGDDRDTIAAAEVTAPQDVEQPLQARPRSCPLTTS